VCSFAFRIFFETFSSSSFSEFFRYLEIISAAFAASDAERALVSANKSD
jgi:hypothetical protein